MFTTGAGESYVLAGTSVSIPTGYGVSFDTCARRACHTRGAKIADALAGGDAGPPAFDVDSIRKDLATMVAEGKTRGASLPLAERTLAVYDEAAKDGWGKRDGASLPSSWPMRSSGRGETLT